VPHRHIRGMTIQEWISSQKRKSGAKVTDETLADLFGCDRTYFSKIRRGKRVPSYELMCAIRDKTGGKVTLESWLKLRQQADQVAA
jgi:transcriptional regulator with XRE-family HTH domain